MPSYARKHQLQHSLVYHAFSRSNGRRQIFSEAEDFQHFKTLLYDYCMRFASKIYHWVIMSNHYHLLIEFGGNSGRNSGNSGNSAIPGTQYLIPLSSLTTNTAENLVRFCYFLRLL